MQASIIYLALTAFTLVQAESNQIISGTGKFGCKYEVYTSAEYNTFPIEPEQYGYFSSAAKTLAECTKLCDEHNDCVAAAYKANQQGQDRCHAAVGQFGFSRPSLNSTVNPSNTVVQLVPNSCNKQAATPTPVACTPGVFKGKGGCKWKFTCNEELGELKYATIISAKSPEKCYEFTQDMHHGFGFTWYQGGDCRINNAITEKQGPTQQRGRTVTAQIVAGSCKKAD